jgi:hypothetical protein
MWTRPLRGSDRNYGVFISGEPGPYRGSWCSAAYAWPRLGPYFAMVAMPAAIRQRSPATRRPTTCWGGRSRRIAAILTLEFRRSQHSPIGQRCFFLPLDDADSVGAAGVKYAAILTVKRSTPAIFEEFV